MGGDGVGGGRPGRQCGHGRGARGPRGARVRPRPDKVPFRPRHSASERELGCIAQRVTHYRALASNGLDAREALAMVKRPEWS